MKGIDHTPPTSFRPGEPLAIRCALRSGERGAKLTLYYRHVDQAERWERVELRPDGDSDGRLGAEIPAAYTDSPYAVQYYFVIENSAGHQVWPGFDADLANQPYVVVRPAGHS